MKLVETAAIHPCNQPRNVNDLPRLPATQSANVARPSSTAMPGQKVAQPFWLVTSTRETDAGAAVVAEMVVARRSARSSNTNAGSMSRE
jgi:hypothetical protein